ncbi:MAG: hypothetical protein K2O40_01645 [Lachnospiraceae bacterium]|nr:hypothetical protein [Lachnospiraceae bacterium]
MKRIVVCFAMILIMALTVCGFTDRGSTDSVEQDEQQPAECAVDEAVLAQQTQELLDSMTLEQKVYQVFIVTPEMLTDGSAVTSADEAARSALRERPVGGLIYFARNLTDPRQTKELLRCTQAFSLEIEGMPLFQCVDEEGGQGCPHRESRGL